MKGRLAFAAVIVAVCGSTPAAPASLRSATLPTAASPTVAPTPDPPSPTLAVVPPSPSATSAPGDGVTDTWSWEAVDGDFGFAVPDVLTVLPDGRLVATGIDDDGQPVLFASDDGRTWERLPASLAFQPGGGCRVEVIDVAAVPSGLVAVGETDCGSQARASAWTSADGRTWKRAEVNGADQRSMTEAFATDDGLVALGQPDVQPDGPVDEGKYGTAIWTSTDSTSWRHVPADEAPPLGIRLSGAVRFGDAFYAAGNDVTVGGSLIESRTGGPGVWRSEDGVHWGPVAGAPRAVDALAVTGDWLVAVGRSPDDVAAEPGRQLWAWRTSDGVAWGAGVRLPAPVLPERPADRQGPDEDPVSIWFGSTVVVAVPGHGLLAVTTRGDSATRGDFAGTDTVVWASPDGADWSPVSLPLPTGSMDHTAAARGPGAVIVTSSGLDGTSHQVLLLGTPVAGGSA
jgi:hypothetical protein